MQVLEKNGAKKKKNLEGEKFTDLKPGAKTSSLCGALHKESENFIFFSVGLRGSFWCTEGMESSPYRISI